MVGAMSGDVVAGGVFVFVFSCSLQGALNIGRLLECALRAGFFMRQIFKFGCASWIFCRGESFELSAGENVGGLIFAATGVLQVATGAPWQAGLLAWIRTQCGKHRKFVGGCCQRAGLFYFYFAGRGA